MSSSSSHPIPPYGVAIQDAIKEGNLQQMKALLRKRDPSKPEPQELKSAYDQLAKEVSRQEKH